MDTNEPKDTPTPTPIPSTSSALDVDQVDKETKIEGEGTKKFNSAEDDDAELDALLNDAVKDFGKVLPTAATTASGSSGEAKDPNEEVWNQAWSEEFIKEATAQFERKMRECMTSAGGSNPPGNSQLPTPLASAQAAQDMSKVVEAATMAAVGNALDPGSVMSQVSEAMKSFAAPPPGLMNEDMLNEEDLSSFMNNLGMGGGDDAQLDDFLPFMTNFMQKLLSKDLLYPVLSDIVDKYPEWLADNRAKLSAEDFEKYNSQYGHMRLICQEYATESPSESDAVKRQRFDRISELMIKVQCCGTPPKDLVGEDANFPAMDPAAFASLGLGGPGGPGGDQCTIV